MSQHFLKLLIKHFLLGFTLVVFFLQVDYGKEPQLFTKLWKVAPFKSNRQDIEKLFKYQSFKEVLQYNYPD